MSESIQNNQQTAKQEISQKKWNDLVNEKIKEAEKKRFPPRFAITLGNSDVGYYITIDKRVVDHKIIFFHPNLNFVERNIDFAIVLNGEKVTQVSQIPGDTEWYAIPKEDSKTNEPFEFLQGSKIHDPQSNAKWKGKYPDVDGVIKALKGS